MQCFPTLFMSSFLEIGDAITDSEMEHITTKATSPFYSEGLFKSEARGGLTPEDTFKPSTGMYDNFLASFLLNLGVL